MLSDVISGEEFAAASQKFSHLRKYLSANVDDVTTKMHFVDAIYFDCGGTSSKLKYENFCRVGAAAVLSKGEIAPQSDQDIVS